MGVLFICIYLCFATATGQMIVLEGDLYVEGIFEIYTQDGNDCGHRILSQSVQHVEAVKWVLVSLNDDNYFGNNKLGFRVHYTCGLVDRASQIAIKIIQNRSGEYNKTVAIIGPETSAEVMAMSPILSGLPEKDRILQIGYSTTAAKLSDKSVFKNFFRVIPDDDVQVKATVRFMEALKWTYFGVIHQDDAYGREAVDTLSQINDELVHPLCLPKINEIDKTLGQSESTQYLQDIFLAYQNDSYRIPGFLSICSEQLSRSVLDAVINLQSQNNSKDFRPVMLFAESFPASLTSDERYKNATKGMYLLSPPTQQIEKFKVYWEKLVKNEMNGTKYFNDYMILTNYTETSPGLLSQNLYTDYVVQAIITVAKVVKAVSSSACRNACLKGDYVNQMENLKVDLDSFDFVTEAYDDFELFFPAGQSDAQKREGAPSYVVYNRRTCETNNSEFCFEKIFQYHISSDTYSLDKKNIRDYYFYNGNSRESEYPNVRKSQCPNGMNCIEQMCPQIKVQDIEVIEGSETGSDMYIVGLAPVHTMSDTPLQCGQIKNGGFDVAEAIKYEVKYGSNVYKSKIPNARIGVIIIDSCNDPQIISSRILQLHSKGIFENGKFRQIKDKILGYIGGWVSDVTLTAASALTRLGYVQVCYAASSPLLSDRSSYPYFMRVIFSDIKQAKKMLSAVKKIGFNLVQVLYSKTAYGTGGMQAIRDHASEYGICIANIVGVEQVEDIDKEEIKRRLTSKQSPKVIMVFLSSFDLEKLISTLDSMQGYMFLASEAWGNRDIISNTKNLHGTITTAYELRVNERFVDYFKTLNPYAKDMSPWLAEYLEKYYNCFFEWSFDKSTAPRKCGNSDSFHDICLQVDPIERCFKIETWAPFSNFAVEALLRGSKITLQELCNTTESICDTYRKNPKKLIENIHPLKFSWNSLNPSKMFDENNDGLIDFNWYQIDMSTGRAEYIRIDLDDIEKGASPRPDVWTKLQSSCSNTEHPACRRCFKGPVTSKEETNVTKVLVLVLASVSFILATFLTVTCVLWKCRPRFCRGGSDDDMYLSAINDGGYMQAKEINPTTEEQSQTGIENPYVNRLYPDDMCTAHNGEPSTTVPETSVMTENI